MTKYKVELKGETGYEQHYVVGLECQAPWADDGAVEPDTLLICFFSTDASTRMKNKKMMCSALYSLYQTNDVLKEGDEFETEFGSFKCVGHHVVESTVLENQAEAAVVLQS